MVEENKKTDEKEEKKTAEASRNKEETKKQTLKEKIQDKKKKPKTQKKTEAVVRGISLPISTLDAMYISKFIKGKTIEKAIADLEEVLKFKRAIPMKGEIPHRKGKGMMSGRYPKKTTENFIKLLKSLQANANANGLEEPIIVEAISNKASQPYGRFGRIKRKRTHVKIKVKEK